MLFARGLGLDLSPGGDAPPAFPSYSRDPGLCGALRGASPMKPQGGCFFLCQSLRHKVERVQGAGGLPFQHSASLLSDLGQVPSSLNLGRLSSVQCDSASSL